VRVVIDTNVFVSGLLNPYGPPGRVIDLSIAGEFVVLFDDRILGEYRAVMHRPRFGFHPGDVQALLDFLESEGEPVVARPSKLRLDDPNDLPFLEVAMTGAADALVTGNVRHFKPKSGRHGVKVLTPAKFCAVV
jgi:putative PIN family toxin of toxin-antitoxin system